MLMAPKSGKETRTLIRGFAQDTKKKVENHASTAQEKAGSYMKHGKHFVEMEKNAFSKGVGAGKEAYKSEKNR